MFRKLEKVDSKLIGDFSSNHALEVIPGPRAKFKYISVQSLAQLMKYGQPNISEVVILDARYGYEFNGGHILNAVNISSEVKYYWPTGWVPMENGFIFFHRRSFSD